jgi:hypothetical protein
MGRTTGRFRAALYVVVLLVTAFSLRPAAVDAQTPSTADGKFALGLGLGHGRGALTTKSAATLRIARDISTVRRKPAGGVSKQPAAMTQRELEAFVSRLKAEGKSAKAVALLLKRARVTGDKAYRVIRKIYNKPHEFMLSLMRSVRYGFASFARNLTNHVRKAGVEWLLRNLKSAGYTPDETVFTLKSLFGFGKFLLLTTWHRIGERADRYIKPVVQRFGMTARELVGWMKSKGFTAAQAGQAVVQAFNAGGEAVLGALIRAHYGVGEAAAWVRSKFSPSVDRMIAWLRKAGVKAVDLVGAVGHFSGYTGRRIVAGMKRAGYTAADTTRAIRLKLNASVHQAAAWLISAGFHPTSVAKALKTEFKARAATVVRALAQANVALASIVNAIVGAFNMTAAAATQLATSLVR